MSAVDKLASLNAGLLRFCIQHSDFTAVTDPSKLPERPKEDYEWLQKALQNFETDTERIKKLLEVLTNKESTKGQLLSSLEELEYLVEDLDNAQTLIKLNGSKPIVDLLQHSEPDVRSWAAQLVSVCTHNLGSTQLVFMQNGALAHLIILLKTESVETVRHKVIGAISSITSSNPTAEAFFIQMHGLKTLGHFLLTSSSASTRTRIIFLLTRLAASHPDIIIKVKEMGFLEPIISAVVDESFQLRETAEKALLWILNHKENASFAKELKLEGIVDFQVKELAVKKEEADKSANDENEIERTRLTEELALLKEIKSKLA